MKKLLVMLTLALGFNLSASHLLAGGVGVFQTSQDSTTVGIWLISDSQGLPMPNSINIEKWEMNSVGWYVQNGTITLTKATSATFQGQLLTNYTSQYLDLDSNKYRFIYRNCCWGMLNNSTSSMNSEFIISADYWHIANNSTPYANIPFIINQQAGSRNTMKPIWGWGAFLTNPDSWDNVSITQTDLHSGYANGVFVPQIYTQLSMHVDNDSISWVPSTMGKYATGFEVKDMRNGQVIGVQRVQWTFIVVSSTLGLEENIADFNTQYEVYDWYGRHMGTSLEGLKGLFVIRYSNGKAEKVLVQ
jgi:hypothetical protein